MILANKMTTTTTMHYNEAPQVLHTNLRPIANQCKFCWSLEALMPHVEAYVIEMQAAFTRLLACFWLASQLELKLDLELPKLVNFFFLSLSLSVCRFYCLQSFTLLSFHWIACVWLVACLLALWLFSMNERARARELTKIRLTRRPTVFTIRLLWLMPAKVAMRTSQTVQFG